LRSADESRLHEQLPDDCAIVSVEGRTWSYERGRDPYGTAITVDSIWPLYCASKPLVAAAALALERLGDLDLDAPLADIVPWRMSRYVASVTPAAILDHRTHLPDVPGLIAFVLSDDDRWRTVYGAAGASQPPIHSRYSVFCGFFVIGNLVEYITGLPLGTAVRALVMDPMGIDDLMFFDTSDEHRSNRPRIVVPAYRSTTASAATLPATGARSSIVATRSNAAFGAYGSVRGLASFARRLAAELAGTAPRPTLSERFVRSLAPPFDAPGFDVTLRRISQFRCGFEVDIGAHGFGTELGPAAFGHTSEGGGITVIVDPARQGWLAAASAMLESDAEVLRSGREHFVDRLFSACGDGGRA
jgi:CubicO group peptidase (beta-lactamase class C family)